MGAFASGRGTRTPQKAENILIIGPNGVGKTTIACNIAYQALLEGHTVRRATASEMLNDLAAQESSAALARRLRHYCNPSLLVLDSCEARTYVESA